MRFQAELLASAAICGAILSTPAQAGSLDDLVRFDIPAQPLETALLAYSRQAGIQVISAADMVANKDGAAVQSRTTARAGLQSLLRPSNLSYQSNSPDTVTILAQQAPTARLVLAQAQRTAPPAAAPPPASAPSQVALEEIIVTARRVEENLQQVPVTVTAVTPEMIERSAVTDIYALSKIIPGYHGGSRFPGNGLATSIIRIRGLQGVVNYFAGAPVNLGNHAPFFEGRTSRC